MNILEIKKVYLPTWYFEKVLRPQDLENFQFYFYSGSVQDDIFVKDIVGTVHENYYHKAWLEMLSSLKRHKDDFNVERIIQTIQREHDGKSVAEYEGKYYILEGNHRLCQAKFLELEEVHCSVSKYQFNHADFDLYQMLLNNGFTCSYQKGVFSNIQLHDLHINVKSKEYIELLISEYKSIHISKFKMFIFHLLYKVNCDEFQYLYFSGDEKSRKNLKMELIHLELRQRAFKNKMQASI